MFKIIPKFAQNLYAQARFYGNRALEKRCLAAGKELSDIVNSGKPLSTEAIQSSLRKYTPSNGTTFPLYITSSKDEFILARKAAGYGLNNKNEADCCAGYFDKLPQINFMFISPASASNGSIGVINASVHEFRHFLSANFSAFGRYKNRMEKKLDTETYRRLWNENQKASKTIFNKMGILEDYLHRKASRRKIDSSITLDEIKKLIHYLIDNTSSKAENIDTLKAVRFLIKDEIRAYSIGNKATEFCKNGIDNEDYQFVKKLVPLYKTAKKHLTREINKQRAERIYSAAIKPFKRSKYCVQAD